MTSGERSRADAAAFPKKRRLTRTTAAKTPRATAATLEPAATSALVRSAPISSWLASSSRYQRTVKPSRGNAGVVPLLNEKSSSNTIGAYRNTTNSA